MNYIIIAFSILFIILIIYYIIILKLKESIEQIEDNLQKLLKTRTDLIPSLYEISKDFLVKHNNIFEEIIKLRKVQFSLNDYNVSFLEFIKNEMAINHEIRFIYGICAKNKKLNSLKKFNYIKNLIIGRNKSIGTKIEKYKKSINLLNSLIKYKNYTILGLILPVHRKMEFDLIKSIF
ncbi:MAG: LemA family protein [Candidatus Gracilibacteria bacterium]